MAENLQNLDVSKLRWEDPEARWESTRELYDHVRGKIQAAIDWYYRKKESRRRGAQWSRLLALVFGAVGVAIPLVSLVSEDVPEALGYLFITAAGTSLLTNRVLGFSSAWIRYVLTAQKLQYLLEQLQLEWIKKLSKVGPEGPGEEIQAEILDLVSNHAQEAQQLVQEETRDWARQFHEDLSELASFIQGNHRTGVGGQGVVPNQRQIPRTCGPKSTPSPPTAGRGGRTEG